jgi:hypothetical protein
MTVSTQPVIRVGFVAAASILGLPTLLLGTVDALTAHTVDARLLGLALVVDAIVLLCAAVLQLWRAVGHDAPTGLTFWAGIGSLVLAAYVLYLQLTLTTNWVWLGVCVMFSVTGGVALILSFIDSRSGSTVPNHSSLTPWTVLAAAGVSATLLFSMFQFWYTGASTASKTVVYGVTLATQLKYDGTHGTDQHLHNFTIHVSVKNTSGQQLQLVRSLYVVTALAFTPTPVDDADFSSRFRDQHPSRFARKESETVVQFGSAYNENAILPVTEEASHDLHMQLPESVLTNYNALALWTQIQFMGADYVRLVQTEPSINGGAVGCYFNRQRVERCELHEWDLESPSWTWKMMKGGAVLDDRLLVNSSGSEQSVWLDSCVDHKGETTKIEHACGIEGARDQSGRLYTDYFARQYKLGYVSNEFELALPPQKKDSQPQAGG